MSESVQKLREALEVAEDMIELVRSLAVKAELLGIGFDEDENGDDAYVLTFRVTKK